MDCRDLAPGCGPGGHPAVTGASQAPSVPGPSSNSLR
jgi:hypothetical protein